MQIIDRKNQQNTVRVKTAKKNWINIAEDYNSGMSATKIAKKYKNYNGQHYSVGRIYSIISHLRNMPKDDLHQLYVEVKNEVL